MDLSDPQAWTMIGIFTTAMLGGMTLMTTQFNRVLRAEIGGLRTEMGAGFEIVNVRLDSLDSRLTRVEGKVDDLDTELTNLATRFWRSQ
ncbi:hypothetical protein [Microbacterium sp. WCS2018Hpa-9]|uniref:hypothetical protein n=1 Tax=Microbacterium sp. WCS2018Hpa-9 TaxID=3073635 RepID=UPI00288A682F|nr:hypothetical protein [Microbacterium sp. WCS2018Hpa-9]